MSRRLSLSHAPAEPVLEQAPAPRYGLDPEVLFSCGILRNPNLPDQAYLRARGLIEQGRYREARTILYPHARTAPEALRTRIADLLAQCSMHGGGEWESELTQALEAHRAAGSATDVARTTQRLGDMQLLAGRFTIADRHLRDASAAFLRLGDAPRAAQVECTRARLRMRAGYVDRALLRVDRALSAIEDLDPRSVALARLDRARILACRGDGNGVAKELVQAERVLGVSGNAADRLLTRLARAESLIALSEEGRAAHGLKRILIDAVSVEDVATRAWVHHLYGRAILDLDAGQARRHLMRAHHLYASISADYHMASCELSMARVDHRLGLNPRARLKTVSDRDLSEWPLLRAELAVARAEILGREHPEQARQALLAARAFGAEHGNLSLVNTVDRTLIELRLVREEELADLTPVDGKHSAPVVESGRGGRVGGGAAPEAMPEDDVSPCRVEQRPVLRPLAVVAARGPRAALAAPRAMGVSPSLASLVSSG